MAFWDVFKDVSSNNFENVLHEKLHSQLPNASEANLVTIACLSGLLARVAWTDLEIHEGEVQVMKDALTKWTDLSQDEIEATVTVSIEQIKELAGLENHKYTEPLSESLTESQRYGILEALFQLAAGDGEVSESESEEIRIISRGLLLETKHFISARATVLEYLGALNA